MVNVYFATLNICCIEIAVVAHKTIHNTIASE